MREQAKDLRDSVENTQVSFAIRNSIGATNERIRHLEEETNRLALDLDANPPLEMYDSRVLLERGEVVAVGNHIFKWVSRAA